MPQQAFESLDGLNLALTGEVWKGLILIDTPGISPVDQDEARAFQVFLGSRPEIEKHLVLRADSGFQELLHAVNFFAGMQPSKLLFTGIDEIHGVGAMAETLMRTGLPGEFLGTGPRIPEDLQELNGAAVAHRLCSQMDGAAKKIYPRAARAAA